jgi:hypothetical protein
MVAFYAVFCFDWPTDHVQALLVVGERLVPASLGRGRLLLDVVATLREVVGRWDGWSRERARARKGSKTNKITESVRTWKMSPEPSSPETCSTAAGRRGRGA